MDDEALAALRYELLNASSEDEQLRLAEMYIRAFDDWRLEKQW